MSMDRVFFLTCDSLNAAIFFHVEPPHYQFFKASIIEMIQRSLSKMLVSFDVSP